MPGEACYLSVDANHPYLGAFFTANFKGRRSSSVLHSDTADLHILLRCVQCAYSLTSSGSGLQGGGHVAENAEAGKCVRWLRQSPCMSGHLRTSWSGLHAVPDMMRCFAGMALCRTGLRSGYTGRHCTCCGWAFPFAATLRLRFRRVQSTGPATRRTALGATFGGNHQGNFDGTLTDNVMQFLCASSLIVGVMACILRRASCKPTSGAHLVRTAIGTRLDIYIRRAGEQSELVLSCFSHFIICCSSTMADQSKDRS